MTAMGKEIIRKSFFKDGILVFNNLRVWKLGPEEEHVLNDGKEEFECIDGNHRLIVLREILSSVDPEINKQFADKDPEWMVDLIKVYNFSKPDIKILV